MTTYLLDTSTFSHLPRAHATVRARIEALAAEDRLVTCAVVRGEILYGLARLRPGRHLVELTAKTASLFAGVPSEPIRTGAAEHYARLKHAAERSGATLGENDLWIAAAACDLGATLVTEDADFRRLPGLACQSWTR